MAPAELDSPVEPAFEREPPERDPDRVAPRSVFFTAWVAAAALPFAAGLAGAAAAAAGFPALFAVRFVELTACPFSAGADAARPLRVVDDAEPSATALPRAAVAADAGLVDRARGDAFSFPALRAAAGEGLEVLVVLVDFFFTPGALAEVEAERRALPEAEVDAGREALDGRSDRAAPPFFAFVRLLPDAVFLATSSPQQKR